jgi:hypothetical protein
LHVQLLRSTLLYHGLGLRPKRPDYSYRHRVPVLGKKVLAPIRKIG